MRMPMNKEATDVNPPTKYKYNLFLRLFWSIAGGISIICSVQHIIFFHGYEEIKVSVLGMLSWSIVVVWLVEFIINKWSKENK